jgi:hypothetical protein
MSKLITVKEALERAMKIIETPDKWTVEAIARDKNSKPVSCLSSTACAFCTVGAIEKALYELSNEKGLMIPYAGPVMNSLFMHLNSYRERSISEWNDSTSHAEVIKVFKSAIASKEAADVIVT